MDSKDYFTPENFIAINGENYNSKDPRTFSIEPLSSSPLQDIVIHRSVAKIDKGKFSSSVSMSSNRGSFLAHYTSESQSEAERLLLRSPKISDINLSLVRLKTAKLKAFYPSWMISRYDINPQKIVTTGVLTVFVLKQTGEFVYFFDEDAFNNVPIDLPREKEIIVAASKTDKRKKYVGLRSTNLNDLVNLKGSIGRVFTLITESYERAHSNRAEAIEVIAIEKDESALAGLESNRFYMNTNYKHCFLFRGDLYERAEDGMINFSKKIGSAKRSAIGKMEIIPFTEENQVAVGSIFSALKSLDKQFNELIKQPERIMKIGFESSEADK